MKLRRLPFKSLPQHFLSIKEKTRTKGPPGKQTGQPVTVVLPHAVIRNLVDGSPHRHGLIGLDGFADAVRREKNTAMQAVTIRKLEEQLTSKLRVDRSDMQLFTGLPDGSRQSGFPGFDSTARAVDFPGTQAPFFQDEKNLPPANHEAKCGPVHRLPIRPVDFRDLCHCGEVALDLPHGQFRSWPLWKNVV